MEIPWYILILPILVQSAYGISLDEGDSDLIVYFNKTGDKYTMDLKENNHDGPDSQNLFYINEVTSEPTCQFLTSSVINNYTISKVSDTSYAFTVNQRFDYETQDRQYQIMCDSEVVILNIINIDDEPPTLTSPMCSMKENVDYDVLTTPCDCILTDPDGWLSQTTFKIINSNPAARNDLEKEDKLFKFVLIDESIPDDQYNTTVKIITQQQLDYETKIFYSFVVQAKDGAGHATTPKENVTSIIDVEDQNDTPPQWTDYFTTMQIVEEQARCFNVTAVDGDKGINAEIEYSLISYDEGVCGKDACVAIDTIDGKAIITVNPIDRDATDLTTYTFEIMAQEKDIPPFTNNLSISFYVEDIDDNSPLFMNLTISNATTPTIDYNDKDPKIAEFTFFENFAGTIDGDIFLQDIDMGANAKFNVELLEDDEEESEELYTNAFFIVPTAGYRTGDLQISVKDASYLDFENEPWQNFSFYVHSYGTEDPTNEDKLLVKIHLLDYNDEKPIFKKTEYNVTVDETIKMGEIITQAKATDRDAEDKTLTHQLFGSAAIINLMDIDITEGIITVAKEDAFDYDRINPVIFQVQAIDHADPPHITTVPVTVNLRDINNKAPTYLVKDIIRVDENQVIGIQLNTSITASDVDTTRDLTAAIDWSKSYVMKNSQRLNSSDPDILKAMQFLDLNFEKTEEDTITITLSVSDNNKNQTAPDYEIFDTLYLDVNITDLNTKVPEFIDQKSIDALITININDINDNAPIFTNDTLSRNRTVRELSRAETIVGTIEAIDLDVGDTVEYSCTYVREDFDWFLCDNKGTITVKNSDEIICDDIYPDEILYNVDITCNATDGFWVTQQNFSIFIIDTNNNEPQININDTVYVLEKSVPDTPVANVNYTDIDRDLPFRTAACSFRNLTEECYKQFKVNEDNEIVVTLGGNELNRDDGPYSSYECTVTCEDNPQREQGEGSKINSTTFIIQLVDINDHCPELQTPKLTTSEDMKEGGLIGKVIGKDIDEGDNAEIDIKILSVTKDDNDFLEEIFIMTQNDDYDTLEEGFKQWHLEALKDLRDYYGSYILQLELSDHGKPPKSTSDNETLKEESKLTVVVSKYSYFAPEFIFPNKVNHSFLLSSEQEPGKQLTMYLNNQKLTDITISDGEDGSCIEKWDPIFNVKLTGSSEHMEDFFNIITIGRCQVQLQVNDKFSSEKALSVPSYELLLTVKLAEDGIPEDKISQSISISVAFANVSGNPVFDQTLGPWTFSMREYFQNESEPLPDERRAKYPNVDDESVSVYYCIKLNDKCVDADDTFELKRTESAFNITAKHTLDYLEKNEYEFYIQAARNESGISTNDNQSLLAVTITVEDVNDHTPQWTQKSFFGAIMKATPKEFIIVTSNATDLDTIDQDHLEYSFNSTITRVGSDSIQRIEDPFKINEATGDIKLNFNVEYNMYGHFSFDVSVHDQQDKYGLGPNYNKTSVTIYIVTEDNTLTFRFENDLDDVTRNIVGVNQAISDGLGWDCHDYSVDRDSQDGVVLNDVTACKIYCVNDGTLVTANEIKAKLNNLNILKAVKQGLLEYKISLQPFSADVTPTNNLEGTLKIALIAVSVVLGTLCIILAVTFFLKLRELNRRLKHLTEPKFGSDESNLNRKGINAPTTNVFAVEGSNPVFNNEVIRDDYGNYDKSSIHSGDSDLIGVEDSPEFDDMFTVDKNNQKF